jgi:hypothetical protein
LLGNMQANAVGFDTTLRGRADRHFPSVARARTSLPVN